MDFTVFACNAECHWYSQHLRKLCFGDLLISCSTCCHPSGYNMIALGGNNDEGVLMVIALLVGLWSPEIQFPITFPIALRHFYNRDHLRPFHSFLKPNSPFNPLLLLLLLLCLSPTQTRDWNRALKTNSNVQTITCSRLLVRNTRKGSFLDWLLI